MISLKKLTALSLALALGISLFAGCSKGDSSSSSASSATSSGASSSAPAVEPMDLTGVTDPYMATAGIAGDTVVAKVGDFEITADNYLYWLYYGINMFSYQNGEENIDFTQTADGETLDEYLRASALETAAFYRLVDAVAEQKGVALSQADKDYIQQDLAAGEEQLGSRELADHVLWSQMHSRDQYISVCETGVLYGLLQEHYYGVGSDGYPTDAEVLSYVEDELGYYCVKHILLSTKDENDQPLDEAGKAEKLAQAEDILAQLQASDDKVNLFDKLMHEHSEDPGLESYPDGYDAFPGQMVPEFEEASLALKAGEISGIVESEHGYHIILRLPLDIDTYRNAVIVENMQIKADQWLEEYPTQALEICEQIDLNSFWNNFKAMQATIQEEVNALVEAKQ